MECLSPVQVAASGARHELHEASGEAVVLLLHAGLLGFVEFLDLAGGEGSPDLLVELEVDILCLTNPLHVIAGPELVPLVQIDVEGSGEVRLQTSGGQTEVGVQLAPGPRQGDVAGVEGVTVLAGSVLQPVHSLVPVPAVQGAGQVVHGGVQAHRGAAVGRWSAVSPAPQYGRAIEICPSVAGVDVVMHLAPLEGLGRGVGAPAGLEGERTVREHIGEHAGSAGPQAGQRVAGEAVGALDGVHVQEGDQLRP